MDTPPKGADALKALTATPFASTVLAEGSAPVPARASEELESSRLTDLTDDSNLEMWALGGTKILGDAIPPSSHAPPEPVPYRVDPPVLFVGPLSYPPVAVSFSERPPSFLPPKKKTSTLAWIVGVGVAAAFGLCMLAAAAAFFLYRANQTTDNDNAMTQAKVTVSSDATTKSDAVLTLAASPAPHPLTTVSGSKASSPPASVSRTPTSGGLASSLWGDDDAKPPRKGGVLQTFAAAAGKPVFVDGTRAGVGGSRIVTACGTHLVAVGSGKSKPVDIPCNGSAITVGSPDGT